MTTTRTLRWAWMKPLAAMPVLACALVLPWHVAKAANCSVSNMTLTVGGTSYSPSACVTNTAQGGGPGTEISNMVSAFSTQDSINLTAKGDNNLLAASDNTSQTFDGLKFTVTASGQKSGTFLLTWTDTNGNTPLNLPVTMDFIVGLYGGNNGDGYLFNSVELLGPPNNTGSGTFTITFLNGGDNNPNLSHLVVGGGNPTDPVPEPASLALFGVGLLGLGFVTTKRRN